MRLNLSTSLFFVLLLFGIFCNAQSSDGSVEIDKARVFPVQRNTTAIQSSNKDTTNLKSESSTDLADKQKSPPKDTSLVINGNGGSTNHPAGGNATLRKRLTFD